MAGTSPTPVRRRLVTLLVVGALAVAGCETGQDPGLDTGRDAPATTSDTLPDCPPGGPDASTGEAGCLAEDGRVLRP